MVEPDAIVVPDAAAWRDWLDRNEDSSNGIWLILAKKGTSAPTSLTHQQALEEALCSGWIDGQAKRVDEATYQQRFTPRRRNSLWSARNVDHIARLTEQGRLRSRGQAEVDKAKADGRWANAYQGQAGIQIPAELNEALQRHPRALATFQALSKTNRYAVLHRIVTARTQGTKSRRIAKLIEMLEQGEMPYPR